MSIVDHTKAQELPWRPGYRVWTVTGQEASIGCTMHYGLVEPGSGAPLHTHESDELIVVLEGKLEGLLQDDKQTVEANQTMVIAKGVPHGFTCVGENTAKVLAFFPCPDGLQGTTYLEGGPPEAYQNS